MRQLILLTLAVSLVHALLLGLVPGSVHLFSAGSDASMATSQPPSFVTRMIAAPAPPATEPTAKPLSANKPATRPAARTDHSVSPTASLTPAVEPVSAAPVDTAGAEQPAAPLPPATGVTALDTGVPASSPGSGSASSVDSTKPPTPTSTAAAATPPKAPASAAAPASTTASGHKLLMPKPVRLVYEGRGEEKGFMKYAASGELLWLPDGSQYSAKLEITYMLLRLRTWTSKGELTDTGLQPLRFGDKPRGAEQAAHFQRDKGIISFSANNPDVPLQPGAQDKLSTFLQLSALVAGEPARYGAGTSIGFQAADAHRAEVWRFKVNGNETLDLPGGTLTTLKLTKEPTVEFDQRIEVWLAPDQAYLPVRMRITEANNTYVDLQWQKTLQPD